MSPPIPINACVMFLQGFPVIGVRDAKAGVVTFHRGYDVGEHPYEDPTSGLTEADLHRAMSIHGLLHPDSPLVLVAPLEDVAKLYDKLTREQSRRYGLAPVALAVPGGRTLALHARLQCEAGGTA